MGVNNFYRLVRAGKGPAALVSGKHGPGNAGAYSPAEVDRWSRQNPRWKRREAPPAPLQSMPATLRVLVPPTIAAMLDLSDYAIYVVSLLVGPLQKGARECPLHEEGWRELRACDLQTVLGQQRVDGKKFQRANVIMGTRQRPGELETRGVMERLPDYGARWYAQRYRLAPVYLCSPSELVEVDVRLRERTQNIAAPK